MRKVGARHTDDIFERDGIKKKKKQKKNKKKKKKKKKKKQF